MIKAMLRRRYRMAMVQWLMTAMTLRKMGDTASALSALDRAEEFRRLWREV